MGGRSVHFVYQKIDQGGKQIEDIQLREELYVHQKPLSHDRNSRMKVKINFTFLICD